MSDADGKNPEFDEFDLPEGDLNLPDGDLTGPSEPDETLEFEAQGDAQEPADDLLETGDELSDLDAVDDAVPSEQDGDLMDAGIDDLSDLNEDGEEERSEEEEEAEDDDGDGKKRKKKKKKEKKKKKAVADEEKGPGFLEKLTSTSPYVVMLGVSLLAIVIGILCLLMELKRYGGQIKPTQARAVTSVQFSPLTSTAAT